MRRVKVLIEGKVQGVFFRANTEKRAVALGLKGYVKNVSKGVEAVFEGEDEKVAEILSFCAIGPEAAKVTGVDVSEESYVGEFEDFKIEY
tara:strand:+ start:712 stop:981 length:270 start_codon:yes stop_codon:yes gene_type:complete